MDEKYFYYFFEKSLWLVKVLNFSNVIVFVDLLLVVSNINIIILVINKIDVSGKNFK